MNRTGLFLFIAVVILAVAAYWYYSTQMKKDGEAATDATTMETPTEGADAMAPAEEGAPMEGEDAMAPAEEAPAEEAPAEETPQ